MTDINAPAIDRERSTRRRQMAVELLLAKGYHWRDGEWITPAPAIDLEQFRMLAQGSVDALTQTRPSRPTWPRLSGTCAACWP